MLPALLGLTVVGPLRGVESGRPHLLCFRLLLSAVEGSSDDVEYSTDQFHFSVFGPDECRGSRIRRRVTC